MVNYIKQLYDALGMDTTTTLSSPDDISYRVADRSYTPKDIRDQITEMWETITKQKIPSQLANCDDRQIETSVYGNKLQITAIRSNLHTLDEDNVIDSIHDGQIRLDLGGNFGILTHPGQMQSIILSPTTALAGLVERIRDFETTTSLKPSGNIADWVSKNE